MAGVLLGTVGNFGNKRRERQGRKCPPPRRPASKKRDILKREKEDKFWDMGENWLHLFHNFQRSGRSCEKTVMKICSFECQHWAKHLWELINIMHQLYEVDCYFALCKLGILRFRSLSNRPGVHQPLDNGLADYVSTPVTASTGLFIDNHCNNNSCNFCSL